MNAKAGTGEQRTGPMQVCHGCPSPENMRECNEPASDVHGEELVEIAGVVVRG